MKYKVKVIQHHKHTIVEATTKEEAELYVAEQTTWEPDFVYFDTERIESDKDKKIKVRFATDNAQLLAGR